MHLICVLLIVPSSLAFPWCLNHDRGLCTGVWAVMKYTHTGCMQGKGSCSLMVHPFSHAPGITLHLPCFTHCILSRECAFRIPHHPDADASCCCAPTVCSQVRGLLSCRPDSPTAVLLKAQMDTCRQQPRKALKTLGPLLTAPQAHTTRCVFTGHRLLQGLARQFAHFAYSM
jgi:hypothetical protein